MGGPVRHEPGYVEVDEPRDRERRAMDGVDRVMLPLMILAIVAAVIIFAWASQQ